jgi:hypothetical protein
MTSSASPRPPAQREYSPAAVALTTTAGILMVMVGIFHAVQGIVALVNDEFFVVGEEYVFEFDLTVWGWTHLVAGIIVALAGVALFQGAVWARTVAVVLACVSMFASFLWLPFYPLWSIATIAFDVFVVWALTAHGRDITQQ